MSDLDDVWVDGRGDRWAWLADVERFECYDNHVPASDGRRSCGLRRSLRAMERHGPIRRSGLPASEGAP